MSTNFWNNPTVEPKRNFRFELSIGEGQDLTWMVKTCEKPKLNVSSIPHKYINHTFNYPGRVVWNPVAVTLVDVPMGMPGFISPGETGGDTASKVLDFLDFAGYRHPQAGHAEHAAATNMEKAMATAALGLVTIRQLANNFQDNPAYVDEWELHNCFIQGDVAFGSLDYASEELTTISFTLQYDWATFKDVGTLKGLAPDY